MCCLLLKNIDAKMSVSSSGKKGRGKVKVNSEGVTGEGATTSSSSSGTIKEPKEPKIGKKNKTKGDQAYEILEKIIIRFPMLIYGDASKDSHKELPLISLSRISTKNRGRSLCLKD